MPFRLPAQEEKAQYVLSQFDRIARGYDLANDCISLGMHRLWKMQALNELLRGQSGNYLDVCCGTGDLAMLIARRLTSGKVTGLDFSGNMLDVARSREAKHRNQGKAAVQLDWFKGDALALPFRDDSFDGAIVSFGLRNLSDYQKGIDEMARVVRPGGKVLNLDLGKPEGLLFPTLFGFYFSQIVPIIGQVLQKDRKAYTYLPESKRNYPDPEGISELFRKAGLSHVRHIKLASGSVALTCGTVQ
ncbi:MAG: bifunctional demethylmenaquinone methyltransferase/2-methoxy-6-polyprenyl-1,4-benzoquinol methylase UbiE [Candidatus Melainabacteria bacterium]|nr:bifunctional demethylmenaquinone methyltransferase/2-methoxy-6-polyprenyl-1,4-benzoquinol methylase UbiE [Candidatus Melainabacteria bacterium]